MRVSLNLCTIETDDGQHFTASTASDLAVGAAASFFIRPEAIIIAPDAGLENFNRLTVTIRSILFDGANSRLLAHPLETETELLIALPQTRQYDYIKENGSTSTDRLTSFLETRDG